MKPRRRGTLRKHFGLPYLPSLDALQQAIGIAPSELDWHADIRSLEAKVSREPLRHYRYHWEMRSARGPRLIEAPKPRMKEIQRNLLIRFLDRIPPHTCAHGFRRGRSIKTFAGPHANRHTVLRMDLESFFPSIPMARVQKLFVRLGYSRRIADRLAGLCTNTVPAWVLDLYDPMVTDRMRRQFRRYYRRPHLPQGAPTSPAVANLCAYGLDRRLVAIADAAGATYTRYADDLLFSGGSNFGRSVHRFRDAVHGILLEEGFELCVRKTRIMRRSGRQHAVGIVLNRRLNVRRRDYDRLKATLHNCAKLGPATQNRDGLSDFRAHLLGRIAHVEMIHPDRGSKLREIFDRIDWLAEDRSADDR